jgi:CTP:molybdopterin cytidylyltransferase MocA
MIPGAPPAQVTASGRSAGGRGVGRAPRPAIVPGLWVIVLAAGASRRFGRAKLLKRLRGESLLQRAARLARRLAGPRCVVVLGARASRMRAELRGCGVRSAVNRRWREGMSTSLAAGLAARAEDLARLLRAARRRPQALVAAGWDDVRGAPVVLPRHVFGRARHLHGDAGARALLRDPSLVVETVPLPAARFDLDRPGDLQAR